MDNNSQHRLNIAVIGVGRFGTRHLEKWLVRKDVELIGFYDIDPRRQKEVSEQYGLPCLDPEIIFHKADMVDIVVPSVSHFPIAKQALRNGCHVFVEKPFTVDTAQAAELSALAEAKHLTVGIGHIERFNPVYIALRDSFPAAPQKMSSVRQGPFIPKVGLDVSVVMELMIHDIDMMLQLFPGEITGIEAEGSIEVSDRIDVARARISFDDGRTAHLFASRNAEDRQRYAEFSYGDTAVTANFMEQQLIVGGTAHSPEPTDAMRDELMAFTQAVRAGHKHIVNEHDGLRSIRVAGDIEKMILL